MLESEDESDTRQTSKRKSVKTVSNTDSEVSDNISDTGNRPKLVISDTVKKDTNPNAITDASGAITTYKKVRDKKSSPRTSESENDKKRKKLRKLHRRLSGTDGNPSKSDIKTITKHLKTTKKYKNVIAKIDTGKSELKTSSKNTGRVLDRVQTIEASSTADHRSADFESAYVMEDEDGDAHAIPSNPACSSQPTKIKEQRRLLDSQQRS